MNFDSKNEGPTGRWRDGLCACFNNGPVCCMTWCCLPVILGQVMTRMSRNLCGARGSAPSTSNTCMIVAVIFAMVTLLCIILSAVMRSKLAVCIINDVKNAYGYAMIDGDCLDKSGYKRINAAVIVFSVVFSMYIFIVACRTMLKPQCFDAALALYKQRIGRHDELDNYDVSEVGY